METLIKSIEEQLYDIWLKTPWQERVPKDVIMEYFEWMLASSGIYVIEREGELLGFYERRFEDDTCFLINVFAFEIGIFRQLYRHFFNTMPKDIKYVKGNKQKLHGKEVIEKITNARR